MRKVSARRTPVLLLTDGQLACASAIRRKLGVAVIGGNRANERGG